MSEKRKDHKGRLLRTGESQRKDLMYQYRYTDVSGKRQTVYSSDLHELRDREDEIRKRLDEGVDYAGGNVTLIELIERYLSLKQGVRHNTTATYDYVFSLIKKEEFGHRTINGIKVSDAKLWIIKLRNDGRSYGTIACVVKVIKPAFQLAYDEDAVRKNPFSFKLSDVIQNDSMKRIAMTDEQQETWMNFVQRDNICSKYYDQFVVLLGTGMRVSEFCGLTKSNIDFENRRICVEHQLLRERKGSKLYVEETKTECGCRFIPMTDDVYKSLKNILADRCNVKVETIVKGHRGFLSIDQHNRLKVAMHIENEMRCVMDRYRKIHPNDPLPQITPHVLRHTFCTNMANAGMDVKNLQYLMGHSTVAITLDVYTHTNYNQVAEQMAKIVDFRSISKREKQEKSSSI